MSYLNLGAYNELLVLKTQQAVANGQEVIATGGDFRGLGSLLKGKNFSKAKFSGASFARNDQDVAAAAGTIKVPNQVSDLSGCNFSEAELRSTNFRYGNLQGAKFDGADIDYADFTGCDLTGATFNNVKNKDTAKFCEAALPDGTVLTQANAVGRSFKPYCKK
jgi:uncharacterized protein YjbI with pentapeptide repeats